MTPQGLITLYETEVCPCCGFKLDFKPWVGESASDEICPSCGIQFGYTDSTPDNDLTGRIEIYGRIRQEWIDSGMKWWSKRDEPADWNPKSQLEGLRYVA